MDRELNDMPAAAPIIAAGLLAGIGAMLAAANVARDGGSHAKSAGLVQDFVPVGAQFGRLACQRVIGTADREGVVDRNVERVVRRLSNPSIGATDDGGEDDDGECPHDATVTRKHL